MESNRPGLFHSRPPGPTYPIPVLGWRKVVLELAVELCDDALVMPLAKRDSRLASSEDG